MFLPSTRLGRWWCEISCRPNIDCTLGFPFVIYHMEVINTYHILECDNYQYSLFLSFSSYWQRKLWACCWENWNYAAIWCLEKNKSYMKYYFDSGWKQSSYCHFSSFVKNVTKLYFISVPSKWKLVWLIYTLLNGLHLIFFQGYSISPNLKCPQ